MGTTTVYIVLLTCDEHVLIGAAVSVCCIYTRCSSFTVSVDSLHCSALGPIRAQSG